MNLPAPPSRDPHEANRAALLKIRELKQQLAAAQSRSNEPIAIVAIGCRFPRSCRSPQEFWQLLQSGQNLVGEVPDDRWDPTAFISDHPDEPGKMYTQQGVFLDDLQLMDPEFFGISPREATWVDPQQRLLMECGWEALERAGWIPEKIGASTGVFVGWMHNDYQNEASDSFLNLNPYIATGAAGSFLCGRLAYTLGLRGPSVAVDTACSSSLVALHLAIQSLQRGDCQRALVGGVNAICSPTTNILTCKLKALSPTGQSRAFDAAADGYVRGEGCGVLALRPLADAQAEGDPILGVIRGSAVGHNGFSSGLTAPNPKAQEEVIRRAVELAGLQPADIDYVEAHGTGTELGDPIEMQGLAAALGNRQQPLLVGSVKTQIGHLEAAAGMAGLIKVVLALETGMIPGQLNFDTPNPHIPWDRLPVEVLTSLSPWPREHRVAGVSAFGMSGTNAHVVVESYRPAASAVSANGASAAGVSVNGVAAAGATSRKPGPGDPPAAPADAPLSHSQPETAGPCLIPLSGKTPAAVAQLAAGLAQTLANSEEGAPAAANPKTPSNAGKPTRLADVAHSLGAGRSHFDYRAAVVADSLPAAASQLQQLASSLEREELAPVAGRKLAGWQFTGQGSQFPGMGQPLYHRYPVFRDAIDQCVDLLIQERGADGPSLRDVMFAAADDTRIHDTRWTQPGLFALQWGLASLWQSWGLQPDFVMGHSVGQYAAACLAGVMSWEDGLRLIARRGELIASLPPGGQMLAIFAKLEQVQSWLPEHPLLALAAANGTHQVVSGPVDAIHKLTQQLQAQSVRCKTLVTSHAFHSSLMDPVLETFAEYANGFSFQRPTAGPALVCNMTGQILNDDSEAIDGHYWARHIREPVLYAPSVAALGAANVQLLLELGPRSVLTAMAASSGALASSGLIPSLKQDQHELSAILEAAGELYAQGASLDLLALNKGSGGRQISLPTYPFQRRRFWGPDKPRAAHAADHTRHPLLGGQLSLAGPMAESRFENMVDRDSPAWMADHTVMGQVTFPGAAWLEMLFAAESQGEWSDVVFERPLRLVERTELQTVVRSQTAAATADAPPTSPSKSVECWARPASGEGTWQRHLQANWQAHPDSPAAAETAAASTSAWIEQAGGESSERSAAQFYEQLQSIGLEYGPAFRTVSRLWADSGQVLCRLELASDALGYHVPPPLLDGALHSLACQLFDDPQQPPDHLYLPVAIGKARLLGNVERAAWCRARWTPPAIDSAQETATGLAGDETESSSAAATTQASLTEAKPGSDDRFRSAEVSIYDEQGRLLLELQQLKVQRVSLDQLQPAQRPGSRTSPVYELEWIGHSLPPSSLRPRRWLVIHSGHDELADSLAQSLNDQQCQVATLELTDSGGDADTAPAGGDGQEFSWRTHNNLLSTSTTVRSTADWHRFWASLWAAWSQEDPALSEAGVGWLAGITWIVPESANTVEASHPPAGNLLQEIGVGGEALLEFLHSLEPDASGQDETASGSCEFPPRELECGLQLVTSSAVPRTPAGAPAEARAESQTTPADSSAAVSATAVDPLQAMYWGLGRVISAEYPQLRCRLVDWSSDAQERSSGCRDLASLLLTETEDNQFAWIDQRWRVPRLASRKQASDGTPTTIRSDGAYLITGGLGVLGRRAAEWLAQQQAGEIVLLSRRQADEPTRQWIEQLAIEHPQVRIAIESADVSNAQDLETRIREFGRTRPALRGVIHAAGLLDDGPLPDMNWARFASVLGPKILGSLALDRATRDLELDFFVLYSSAASVLGSPGQSNYAMANAFMDGLAWNRSAAGRVATSINWGPWAEGMADDERVQRRMELQGVRPLQADQAHRLLEQFLHNPVPQVTVIDADWRRMRMGMGGKLPAMLADLAPASSAAGGHDSQLVAKLKALQGNARRDLLHSSISDLLHKILGSSESLDGDRPLVEMGLDSLMAVELSTGLQQMVGDGFQIAPTMLFDHPTLNAITQFILDQLESSGSAGSVSSAADSGSSPTANAVLPESPATPRDSRMERDDIAIIGLSCRFPGACNPQQFWENLINGVDSVGPIPSGRWDVDRFYSEHGEPGKMNTRQGGFLTDIAEFDAEFFNISPQEACWIDPQHRMLLEQSYLALENAGLDIPALRETGVGVFMGIMGQDYAFLPSLDDETVVKAFQGAGLSHSAGVGRISYTFGFEGPCIAVDSASSSSLVALLQAARSLQEGQCQMALAGAANAILAPVNSLLMSQAGLLAPDGRCKSFSAAADGFGRGEGCGVVVLKPLRDAVRDGDSIRAVLRGGAIVHNGASSAITAPNGKSQTRVIELALRDAGLAPSDVQYLEAHGTGTEFGDPLELTAAAKVYARGRKPNQPLRVGSVKSNIGHLEAAGGMSGLIKVILAMQHGTLPGQVHFDEPSPHIPWQRLPLQIVQRNQDWEIPEPADTRVAAVTALGLVGTHAHVILSSPPIDLAQPLESHGASSGAASAMEPAPALMNEPATAPCLLALSGRTHTALAEVARRMSRKLQGCASANPTDASNLRDVCHTAAVGRSHLELRAAICFRSLDQALQQLEQVAKTAAQLKPTVASPAAANGSPANGHDSDNADSDASDASDARQPSDGVFLSAKSISARPRLAWFFEDCPANDALPLDPELLHSEPLVRQTLAAMDQRLEQHNQQQDQQRGLLQAGAPAGRQREPVA